VLIIKPPLNVQFKDHHVKDKKFGDILNEVVEARVADQTVRLPDPRLRIHTKCYSSQACVMLYVFTRAVLCIRRFFSDPDLTFQMVSDPTWFFSSIFNIKSYLCVPRLVNVACVLG
jgi:hypothetical protein